MLHANAEHATTAEHKTSPSCGRRMQSAKGMRHANAATRHRCRAQSQLVLRRADAIRQAHASRQRRARHGCRAQSQPVLRRADAIRQGHASRQIRARHGCRAQSQPVLRRADAIRQAHASRQRRNARRIQGITTCSFLPAANAIFRSRRGRRDAGLRRIASALRNRCCAPAAMPCGRPLAASSAAHAPKQNAFAPSATRAR